MRTIALLVAIFLAGNTIAPASEQTSNTKVPVKESIMSKQIPSLGESMPLCKDSLLEAGAPIPRMQCYLSKADKPCGAVIVFPGGGYSGLAPLEAVPIAQRLNKDGFHAFIVYYRVSPHRHPEPILDAATALSIVRENADAWGVIKDKIAVLGFSAGGHLAASLGVLASDADSTVPWPKDRLLCRPDAMVLCYPVISSGPFGHQGSFNSLLGADATQEERRAMSLELRVTEDTPPTFLWSTANDEAVPVENSLLFSQALSRNHVPFELHVYPDGPHGMDLAQDTPHVATWMPLCVQWLTEMGW